MDSLGLDAPPFGLDALGLALDAHVLALVFLCEVVLGPLPSEWPYVSPARSINVQFISGAFHELWLQIFLLILFMLFRNRGPSLFPFIRSCLLIRFMLISKNTTLIMNHPALSKLMPNHLTVRAKWREPFIFHISYKSKV